jgi:CNT family concentrative nucleoside transporter
MLIAFLGLLAFFNALLGWFGGLINLPQLSLEWICSYLRAASCLADGGALGGLRKGGGCFGEKNDFE